ELPNAPNLGADLVIGQFDLFSKTVNGADEERRTMAGPRGIAVDQVGPSHRLFVADTEARRILLWLSPPGSDGQAADKVIRNVEAVSIAIRPEPAPNSHLRMLAAAEANNGTVLLWRNLDPNTINNDVRPDPTVTLSANLEVPRAVWFDTDGRLFVSDASKHPIWKDDATVHNRVLVWEVPPTTGDQPPTTVALERPGLAVGAPSAEFLAGYAAGGAAISHADDGTATSTGTVYVTDPFAHRVVWFTAVPAPSGGKITEAQGLFGQPRFVTAETNADGVSARSLFLMNEAYEFSAASTHNPEPGLAITRNPSTQKDYLWIADTYNNRVLRVPLP
ncbi:hypothetical protein ACFL59_09625, partial [Planctomycetota bacterium]